MPTHWIVTGAIVLLGVGYSVWGKGDSPKRFFAVGQPARRALPSTGSALRYALASVVNSHQLSEIQRLILASTARSDAAENFLNGISFCGFNVTEVSMHLNMLDLKLIVLVAAVILIIALVAWLYVRKRRNTTAGLRQKFGPEYDHAVLRRMGQKERRK